MRQQNNRLRWIILGLLVALAAWKIYPTIRLATIDQASFDALDREAQVSLRSNSIKQGLDLQGGMRVVLEVDMVELVRGLADNKDSRFEAHITELQNKLTATSDFWSEFQSEFADVQLHEYFGDLHQTNDEIITDLRQQAIEAVDNSLVILRNRVDGSGLQEPSITKQGNRRIVVELAGVNDPEAARRMIGRTALLEFKLVEEVAKTNMVLESINDYLRNHPVHGEQGAAAAELAEAVGDGSEVPAETASLSAPTAEDSAKVAKGDSVEDFDPLAADAGTTDLAEDTENPLYSLMVVMQGRNSYLVPAENREDLVEILETPAIQELIPPGSEFLFGRTESMGEREYAELFMVRTQAELSGKYLKTAGVNIDQGYNTGNAGASIVELELNNDGARIFARVTGDNINRRLAIVLDDRVFMAPNIRSKIPNGRAIIEGLDSIDEAKELANLLRHGALPSTVKPVEERTVGPSLGLESVQKGAFSAVLGFVMVILFMMVFYKKSGVGAVIALLLNMLFILAILAGFNATLTLPGIAGIVLTIGMAVDANVLILERIKEELRAGKTVRSAVEAGYSSAFRTIVDANVTTLIAGVVLYQFGSGPIRGFALTLMIGIACSMYTAVVVTRLLFDMLTDYDNKSAKLSI